MLKPGDGRAHTHRGRRQARAGPVGARPLQAQPSNGAALPLGNMWLAWRAQGERALCQPGCQRACRSQSASGGR